jgi:hypothetical protein
MAADYRHIGGRENRLGRHYSRFSAFWLAPALAGQSLARRKLCDAGSNRRSRANAITASLLMRDFFRLHESRWEPMVGHGVCADPVVREFQLQAAQRMLDAGMLASMCWGSVSRLPPPITDLPLRAPPTPI